MTTIASSSTSYASFQDLINRFDVRPLEELLSDYGIPLSPAGLPTYPPLVAIMQEASGVLEAAATAGQRYLVGPSGPPTPTVVPTLSTSTSGGTIATGTYQVAVTYVNTIGESLPFYSASITTSGSTSTITVASPANNLNTTGWNAYFTQAGGTTYTLQNTLPVALGTNFTLTTPPTSTGANPPTTPVANQNDLMAIATSGTNTGEFLKGIVSAIAYSFIWDRRPEWIGGDPEKAGFRVKMAMDMLDKLASGAWVFGELTAQQAGLPEDTVETEEILQQQRRITKTARAIFGPRNSDYVGMNPPPQAYP